MDLFDIKLRLGVSRSHSGRNKSTVLNVYTLRILKAAAAQCYWKPEGGGRVLPYMSYIGMCGPKGYGFSAVLVINRVSILAYFGNFGHKKDIVFAL